MKRLFAGLVLLMMAFLATLPPLEVLRALAVRSGAFAWVPELLLALVVVTAFARITQLHRRLLFPRRGGRLLAAGLALYAVAVAVATGAAAAALRLLPLEPGSPWAGAADLAARMVPLPLFLAAQVLLALGAFRALSNLVPPQEFAEDF